MTAPLSTTAMPIGISQPVQAGNRSNHGGKAQTWTLNQLLKADVVRLGSGETALRINGAVYRPLGASGLLPGTARQFRVAALDPVVQLTPTEAGKLNNSPIRLAATEAGTLMQSTWASSLTTSQHKLAALLTLLHNPPAVLKQQLSEPSLAASAALANWIPRAGDLKKPSRLKTLLQEVSVLSGHVKANGAQTGTGTLLELFGQLRNRLLQQLGQASGQAQHAALQLYKGGRAEQDAVLATLLKLLNEAGMQSSLRTQAADSKQQSLSLLWNIGIPVILHDNARIISFAIARRRDHKRRGKTADRWHIRCNCELGQTGPLAISIDLHECQVSIELQCAQRKALKRLQSGRLKLAELLADCELELQDFSCSQRYIKKKDSDSLAHPHSHADNASHQQAPEMQNKDLLPGELQSKLQAAAESNRLPVLEDFDLDGTRLTKEFPESAYKALACLFVYLLD